MISEFAHCDLVVHESTRTSRILDKDFDYEYWIERIPLNEEQTMNRVVKGKDTGKFFISKKLERR